MKPIKINICGVEKLVYSATPFVKEPVYKTNEIPVKGNVILVINRGDTTVLIDDNLTVPPGESFEFASRNDFCVLEWKMHVQFVTTATETNNRLEIVEFHVNIPEIKKLKAY